MESWQFTTVAWFYITGLLTTMLVSVFSIGANSGRSGRYFTLMTASISLWILGYILGFFNTDLAWKLVCVRIEYLGTTSTSFFFIMFTLNYIQMQPGRRQIALLALVPATIFFLVLFLEQHQLIYRGYGTTTMADGFVLFTKDYGAAFYLWAIYANLILAGGGILFVVGTRRMPARYRPQSLVIGISVVVVLLSIVMFVSGNNPISPYDPTPLLFSVLSVLTLMTMHLYGFLNIVPVAHNQVFHQIKAGVLVLNNNGRIVDLNIEAARMLGHKLDELLGEPFSRHVHAQPASHDLHLQIQVSLGQFNRTYDVEITPFRDREDLFAGHIVLLYDVTEQNQLIEELQSAIADVKLLQGMLPICAACKNIRDDEGYWQEIETFMRDHSEATFSHGICPTCEMKLYPHINKPRD